MYLLLRGSGLTYINTIHRQSGLIVDEKLYEQWVRLSPTERYFSLLDAWVFRCDPEIIGEHSYQFFDITYNFFDIISFLNRHDLEKGLQIAGKRNADTELRYSPGLHNLGLLDLFGLIDIQSGAPVPDKGWQIEKIKLTPFGHALMALIYTEFFSSLFESASIFTLRKGHTGTLQKVLRPYFPRWNHNLRLPKPIFRSGTYVFKVSLGSAWRRIAIDAKETLDALAQAILASVNFDEDHLYEFNYRNRFGTVEKVNHWYMEEPLSTSIVRVGDLPIGVGQSMIFLFDYGDNWEFDVLLEAIDSQQSSRGSSILEARGEPPEQYPQYSDDEDFELFLFDEELDEDDKE